MSSGSRQGRTGNERTGNASRSVGTMDVEDGRQNRNRRSSCDIDPCSDKAICGYICYGILFIVSIILIAESLVYMSWNEIGLRKNTITKDISTEPEDVLSMGRHFVGLGQGAERFPAVKVVIKYDGKDLQPFSKGGSEFEMEAHVYYQLNKTSLPLVYEKFSRQYPDRFKEAIRSGIKNAAPRFTVEQYITDRRNITKAMLAEVNKEMVELHLSIKPYDLLIHRITFPKEIEQKFLDTANQVIENNITTLQRTNDLTIEETLKQEAVIRSFITVIDQRAKANGEAIIKSSEAEAEKITQEAIGAGIAILLNTLEVEEGPVRDSLFELLTIMDNQGDPKVVIGDLNALINIAPTI